MKKILLALIVPAVIVSAAPSNAPTIEAFLSPGYPTEIVSARKAYRIAWTAYERGRRNVYTAAAPAFAHAGHMHTYMGTVSAVHAADLVVSTVDGKSITVPTSTATAYQHADNRSAPVFSDRLMSQ